MGEILGLGISHQPTLARRLFRPKSLEATLADPGLPEHLRDPVNWPEAMRFEWGDDDGVEAAERHREEIVEGLRLVRKELDEFSPDFVVVWGDDQYENFREDIIPPFCVLAYDQFDTKPWDRPGGEDNYWQEPADHTVSVPGDKKAAKSLISSLIEADFDVSYAYKPLHKDLGHAFLNSVLFLDWDRRGFPYPIIPFQVNCYGRRVISQKGYREKLSEPTPDDVLDPPSPSPARCFALGAETARIFRDGPSRVALIASSSWSHAFLTRKNNFLHPDHASDRRFYEALVQGDYDAWKSASLAEIENSGQHELLNWFCLAGAMSELGRRPDHAEFIESSIMNSNKVIAVYRP